MQNQGARLKGGRYEGNGNGAGKMNAEGTDARRLQIKDKGNLKETDGSTTKAQTDSGLGIFL